MLVLLSRVAPSPPQPAPFDWAGQVLAIVALAALIYGLIHGGSIGFGSPSVVLALVVAAAGMVAFLRVASPRSAIR